MAESHFALEKLYTLPLYMVKSIIAKSNTILVLIIIGFDNTRFYWTGHMRIKPP